jgi:type I restriction enzyme, S subunit
MSAKVKPGYKQTDAGVIPVDWDVAKLGKHVAFKTGPFGSTLHKSDYVDGGVPVINPMQIVDGKIQPTQSMAITEQAARNLADFRLCAGNVVIGRRGEMGRCAVVRPEQDGWLCGTGSMIIRTGPSLDARFLQRVLSSPPVIAAIENASVGSTMINLNHGTLGNLLVSLPPTKAEQEAIAEALSDAEDLIESLEQLVVKKRHVKQGTMQELLTGKKRLPGFSGEWEPHTFGEMFDILHSASNSRSDLTEDGEVGYLHYGDIHTHSSAFLDCSSELRTFIASPKVASVPTMEDGDLVMVDASEDTVAIGKAVEIRGLDGHKAVAGLHTILLRSRPGFLVDGFKGYLQYSPSVRSALVRFATGVSVYGVSKSNVKTIEVAIPKPDEQTAIAAILSDMDAEIAALDVRLAKARQVKQGMMQELLTGKTRLV